MPGTSTPVATRASRSGWSGRTRSPPPAPTRRTRSSRRAATRSIDTRPSMTSPTTSPTCRAREMTEIHTHEPGDHENAYDGLLVNDAHWAFGTDFEDPLAGVDTTVPDGVDATQLATYCLMLGDDALVLSQRLSEWCSRAPDLEEDIALANIALDL